MDKENWSMLYKLYKFWKIWYSQDLTGGLQQLDFPPFPVFLKLSHTPELSWEFN